MENNSRRDIGKRLIAIREKLELTQEELGKILAGKDAQGKENKPIARETISKYESGSMDISKGAQLELFSTLNVSKEYLFHGVGEMFAQSVSEKSFSLAKETGKPNKDTPYPPPTTLAEYLLLGRVNDLESRIEELTRLLEEKKKKGKKDEDVED